MGGYSQVGGLGGEHLGYVHIHIYEWIWGWLFLYIPHTRANAHVKIDQYTILASKIYTASFPERKLMKTSPHQGFHISILITNYAHHLHIHRHICTSYIYTHIHMYVIEVVRGKTCIHLILNIVSLSNNNLSHDSVMKKVTCYQLIISPPS